MSSDSLRYTHTESEREGNPRNPWQILERSRSTYMLTNTATYDNASPPPNLFPLKPHTHTHTHTHSLSLSLSLSLVLTYTHGGASLPASLLLAPNHLHFYNFSLKPSLFSLIYTELVTYLFLSLDLVLYLL